MRKKESCRHTILTQQTSKPANQQTSKPANQQTSKPANQQTSKPANQQKKAIVIEGTLEAH
ncbi:MAG: hypothetical protein ACRCRW_08180 [Aeromonadaceae bacterium]